MTPSDFFQGATFTLRRDGSGKIEWNNLQQLARVEIGEVLQYAQQAQRDEQHAVTMICKQ